MVSEVERRKTEQYIKAIAEMSEIQFKNALMLSALVDNGGVERLDNPKMKLTLSMMEMRSNEIEKMLKKVSE